MQKKTGKSQNKKVPVYYAGIAVMVLFLFVLPGVVKPWAPMITENGVTVVCTFIGCVAGILMTTDLMIPAMLSMCSLVCYGVFEPSGIIAAYMGSSIVWQVIVLFALCYVIVRDSTGETIANIILTRKFVQGRPMLIIMVLMFAFAIAAIFLGVWGCLIIGFPLLRDICKQVNLDINDKFARLIYLGCYISMCTGGNIMGTMNASNVALNEYFITANNVQIQSWEFSLYALLFQLVFIIVYPFCIKFVFRCDMSALANADLRETLEGKSLSFTRKQVVPLIAFLLIGIYTFCSGFLPESVTLFATLKGMGGVLFATLVLAILAVVHVDGEQIFNPAVAFKEGINWPIVMAIASLATIGGQLVSDDYGVKAWLVEILGNSFTKMNPVMCIIVAITLTIALTNFFSNTATQFVMSALIASLCGPLAAAGYHIGVLPAAIGTTAQVAFLTYASSGQASLLLSERNITNKFVWTQGIVVLVIWIVTTSLVSGIIFLL